MIIGVQDLKLNRCIIKDDNKNNLKEEENNFSIRMEFYYAIKSYVRKKDYR